MPRAATPLLAHPQSLLAVLASWDAARVERLLTLRPDLATGAPLTGLGSLAARAEEPTSVVAAIEDLDEFAAQVLDAAVVCGAGVDRARLAAVLDVAAEELAGALGRLAARALVVADHPRPGQLWLLPQLAVIRYPAGLGPPARQVLGARTVEELKDRARTLGLNPTGRRKAELVDDLAARLADPAVVRAALRRAPAAAVTLAEQLAHATPVAYTGYNYGRADQPAPAEWLAGRGLLVALDWGRLVMPREVSLALRGGRLFPEVHPDPPPLAGTDLPRDRVDDAAAAQAMRLLRDVTRVVDVLARAPAQLLAAGGLGVRELRRVSRLAGLDEALTTRLVELAATAGLLGVDRATREVLPAAGYDDWRVGTSAQRWRVLAESWLTGTAHLSIGGAPGEDGKPRPALLPYDGSAGRQRRLILETLADCTGAPERRSLVRRLRWLRPRLWSTGPADGETQIGWVLDEAALLGFTGAGALAAFGRHLVSGEPDAATEAFARHTPPVTDQVVVQADLTALATGELPAAVRDELELLADVDSADVATVFRFSAASLRRAFDAGRTAEQITGFLERHAQRGVPQPLRYLVADLGRRHGQLRVGAAVTYLRCDDPGLLAEVAAGRGAAALGLHRIAPGVLVAAAAPADVVAALRAAGHLPALEDPTGAVVPPTSTPRRAPALNKRRAPARTTPVAAAGELARRLTATQVVIDLDAARVQPGTRTRQVWCPDCGVRHDVDADGVPMLFDPLRTRVDGDSDGPPRPTGTIRDPAAVKELLALATEEQWALRLSYTNAKGRGRELSVFPMELAARQLVAEDEAGAIRNVPLAAIGWARVLSEVEQEVALGI